MDKLIQQSSLNQTIIITLTQIRASLAAKEFKADEDCFQNYQKLKDI